MTQLSYIIEKFTMEQTVPLIIYPYFITTINLMAPADTFCHLMILGLVEHLIQI